MKTTYLQTFVDLVNDAYLKTNNLSSSEMELGNPFYVGFGNPNSKILILGKEKGFDISNVEQLKYESLENPNEWKFYVDNSTNISLDKFYINSQYYINAFTPYSHCVKSGHTWNKYHTLLKFIYPEILNENNDFFKYSFVSEINFQPSRLSVIKKFNNEKRMNILKNNYFKSFNVIILACGNYLNQSLIQEIFDVKYDNESDLSQPRQKLKVYRNDNRIVINTRQLSFDVSNEYLKLISEVAKNHI
jgi:hypothetical protein